MEEIGNFAVLEVTCGNPHKGNLCRGLSGVTGNCFAPFLGGSGLATASGYLTI